MQRIQSPISPEISINRIALSCTPVVALPMLVFNILSLPKERSNFSSSKDHRKFFDDYTTRMRQIEAEYSRAKDEIDRASEDYIVRTQNVLLQSLGSQKSAIQDHSNTIEGLCVKEESEKQDLQRAIQIYQSRTSFYKYCFVSSILMGIALAATSKFLINHKVLYISLWSVTGSLAISMTIPFVYNKIKIRHYRNILNLPPLAAEHAAWKTEVDKSHSMKVNKAKTIILKNLVIKRLNRLRLLESKYGSNRYMNQKIELLSDLYERVKTLPENMSVEGFEERIRPLREEFNELKELAQNSDIKIL